jgi:PAS domain S-box-containing protein
MHPLLRRLFDEHIGQGTPLPPGWDAFVQAVNDAWDGAAPAGELTFRTLAETISAAVFVYQGSRFRYVNAAATALTGYSAEELLRMDFWGVVHPLDREMVRERGMARQRGEPVPKSSMCTRIPSARKRASTAAVDSGLCTSTLSVTSRWSPDGRAPERRSAAPCRPASSSRSRRRRG